MTGSGRIVTASKELKLDCPSSSLSAIFSVQLHELVVVNLTQKKVPSVLVLWFGLDVFPLLDAVWIGSAPTPNTSKLSIEL